MNPQSRIGPANPPGDSVIQKKKGSTSAKKGPTVKGGSGGQPKGTTGKGQN